MLKFKAKKSTDFRSIRHFSTQNMDERGYANIHTLYELRTRWVDRRTIATWPRIKYTTKNNEAGNEKPEKLEKDGNYEFSFFHRLIFYPFSSLPTFNDVLFFCYIPLFIQIPLFARLCWLSSLFYVGKRAKGGFHRMEYKVGNKMTQTQKSTP